MGDPGLSGRFGRFGGRYVPEALAPACRAVEAGFRNAWADPEFRAELSRLLAEYCGRPTPVTRALRLSEALGVRVLLKREDLNHTGSHKLNNALGQALLARRMGKRELMAETGAGQHGVATATAAALLGMKCTVYMGEVDMARQELNVYRMETLGAQVIPVRTGARTLKDATSEAFRHWVTRADESHYCLGSVLGPHPYPWIVREFQSVIGIEAAAQCAQLLAGGVPDVVVACVGGDPTRRERSPGSPRRRRDSSVSRVRVAPAPPTAPWVCCTARCRCICRTMRARCSKRIPSLPVSTIRGWGPSTPTSPSSVARTT
ncbi:pyridoxal-phosphate dependent enzyme family protein [Rhodococcus sp. MTM3W5.2]|nr:pyridoxal-phosphate dependent enzyme family protein [Rhodococcus sp. MTM3W5.2]